VVYNAYDQTMRHQVWRGVWNLGNEMNNAIATLNNNWLKNALYFKVPQFFFSLREGGPIWCSEGKLTEKACRRMMGYAIRDQRLYLPREVTNPYASNSKSSKRGYMVVSKEKEGGKVEKKFTREAGKSNQQRTEVIKDKKYSLGFRWWPHINWAIDSFKSEFRGRETNHDTYEFIAEWFQTNYKIFNEGHVTEKELNCVTQNDWNKKHDALRNKLRKVYNGDGSNLVRNELWSLTWYDKSFPRMWIGQHFWRNNMRYAIHTMANTAANYLKSQRHRTENPFEFMFSSRNGGIHYCSASDDLTNKDCQRMMGWAMVKHQNYFTPQRREFANGNKGLLDVPGITAWTHFALVMDKDGKVERMEFEKNRGNSIKKLEAVAGEGKKYTTGALLHNQRTHLTLYKKISALKFEQDGFDIYEMFAKYLQDQGLYKKATTNENDNALETHKLRNTRHKEEEEKKLGAVLKARKAPNVILQSNYLFRVYYFNMNNGRVNYNNVRNTNNWHQALDAIKNNVYNGKIRRD